MPETVRRGAARGEPWPHVGAAEVSPGGACATHTSAPGKGASLSWDGLLWGLPAVARSRSHMDLG